jgi:hypothetical protein
MKHFLAAVLLFCNLVLFALPLTAGEQHTPDIKDIIITTSETHLILFATVANAFTGDMIEGVQNGLPITFNFHIELDKVRSGWFDATLVETNLSHTLKYDAIRQEYAIEFSEKKGKVSKTRSLEQAKQLMTEINGFPLIARKELEPDAPYALRIKATLVETTLPLGMHYILPFTSLWDFETDWRTVEFRY